MKISSAAIILGVVALIALVPSHAEENELQLETSGRRLQDATTVGVGFTPTTVITDVSGEVISSSEDELVKALERDDQVTVIGDVQLGELLCDSLAEAENATLLNFPISTDEAIIAEKISYDVLDGEFFRDGMARKVWNGKEVEDSIEGAHRTVSMTWGEECDVEYQPSVVTLAVTQVSEIGLINGSSALAVATLNKLDDPGRTLIRSDYAATRADFQTV